MSILQKLKKLFTPKGNLAKTKQPKLTFDITVESSTVTNKSEPNVVISPIPANVIVDIQTAIILDYYRGRNLDIYQPFYLKEIAGYRIEAILNSAKEKGYLRNPAPKELLSSILVPDLKTILRENNLKVSGRKKELIARILQNVKSSKYVGRIPPIIMASESGEALIKNNYIYIRNAYNSGKFGAIYNCIQKIGCDASQESYYKVENTLYQQHLSASIRSKDWGAVCTYYSQLADLNLEVGHLNSALEMLFRALCLSLSGMGNNNTVESYNALFVAPDLADQLNKLTFTLKMTSSEITNTFQNAAEPIFLKLPFSYFPLNVMENILLDILTGEFPEYFSTNLHYTRIRNMPSNNSHRYNYYGDFDDR